MATTTTHAGTPEPFLQSEAPRTPTSLSSSNVPTTNGHGENPNLLRPQSGHQRIEPAITDVSPKSHKLGPSPGSSPLPLTGQAAMVDIKRRKQHKAAEEAQRQTSPNPSVAAMHALMGGGGISRASDAPAPDKLGEPMRKAAEKIHIPEIAQGDSMHASPVSVGSFGTIESTRATSAMTATANTDMSGPQFVAEPAQMTEAASYPENNHLLAVAGEDGKTSYSYPGPPVPEHIQQEGGPARGMSLPGYGQGSPKSPPTSSNKRHKCPYCSTDFTRHHNLKSHLLTHSQEKPYVCQTCQARFRRLHDLKRHTKLHTGERPHTCDKCGRRFARGDALARHNKGPGGCAGRRSSFGGEDDFGDGADGEGMDGVEYGVPDGEDGPSPEEQGRRGSEPSRKRSHLETPQDQNREVYRQHSSTYPPVQGRPHAGSVGSMGPPTVIHPGGGTATSPREMSGQPSPAGNTLSSSYYPPGQVFQQQGMMTESPKPLSPGQPAGTDQQRLSVTDASMSSIRNRSPSLTTQFQQQYFGRKSGGGSPHQPQSQFPPNQQAPHGAPVLPPLGSQPQGRPGFQASLPGGPGPSMLHHQQVAPGPGSNPGSLSSHGRSSGSGGSMRDHMDSGDIWNYVRSLESRFSRMQDEYELRISRLQEELISLKGQMSNAGSYSSDMQGPPRY